MKNKILLLY